MSNTEVLSLFPETAASLGGRLSIGGVAASELAATYGTPLLVYDEATIRSSARAYRAAAPNVHIHFGSKAFPNVEVLHILREEGIGADVASLGELAFAQRAGYTGAEIVVHGNNKSDAELAAAAAVGALVAIDSLEELDRAKAAGIERGILRITPGIDADTHEAIRTAHHGSKFGVPPEVALDAIRHAPWLEGLHTHIGSQLFDAGAALMTADWIAAFAARARTETGWTPKTIDIGGGLGVATAPEDPRPSIHDFAGQVAAELERAWAEHGLPPVAVMMEPGRSLVGRAGVTLYSVGTVKQAADGTTYVAVDGGMSDNPRRALYQARYTAVLADRVDDETVGRFTVAGKHCESGDVLIDRVELPEPHRGDVLAVPATGAYTLSMASNYNALLRPAAVLVADGHARLIRRRETLDDLFALES